MNDEMTLTLEYWQLFRNGYEFNLNGTDMVIRFCSGDIILGSVSKCKVFRELHRALHEKVFDGLILEDFIRIDEREESMDEDGEEFMDDEWEEAMDDDFV